MGDHGTQQYELIEIESLTKQITRTHDSFINNIHELDSFINNIHEHSHSCVFLPNCTRNHAITYTYSFSFVPIFTEILSLFFILTKKLSRVDFFLA